MQSGETSTRAKITDEAIEELRKGIGEEWTLAQYNRVATEDAITHYALGMGDDNPRYLDSAYAAGTRWGAVIAHPTFVLTCGFPRVRGLPGVHGLFTGIDVHCHHPIKAGTRISAKTSPFAVDEHTGRFAGRTLKQVYETHYRDEAGTVLSTLYSHAFRTERKAVDASDRQKYADIQRQTYTDEDLERIDQAYARELQSRRGATPLYWDDLSVGQAISELVKGPLTVTDMICFKMGFGYIYTKAHRQAYQYRKKHPGAAVKDEHGVWDIPERVHWEDALARAIGMPATYDYGPQRIAWFDHCLSDWMGDDGWVRRLKVSLRAPNFVGDTTWIRGNITHKDDSDGSVQIDMRGEDQRGRVTAIGYAEVVLPRR